MTRVPFSPGFFSMELAANFPERRLNKALIWDLIGSVNTRTRAFSVLTPQAS
jgi:hypothetical protein